MRFLYFQHEANKNSGAKRSYLLAAGYRRLKSEAGQQADEVFVFSARGQQEQWSEAQLSLGRVLSSMH
jgi:hypothetical protein